MQTLPTNTPTLVIALIIGLVAGLVVGWLVAYLPAQRKSKALRQQNARLESSLMTDKLEGEDAHRQLDLLRGELRTVTTNQTELRNQLLAAQETKAQLDLTLQQRDAALDELKRELALAQDELAQAESRSHATASALGAELEAARTSLKAAETENERLAGELSLAQVELANARQALFDRPIEMVALRAAVDQATQAAAGKQTALDEAYGRAATLLQAVEERDARVAAFEAELGGLRGELDTALAQRRALEAHLRSVRGDVAGEMVRVAQALIKVRDEQLAEANARREALATELAALRGQEN
jgi:chromosome segregation ATPase